MGRRDGFSKDSEIGERIVTPWGCGSHDPVEALSGKAGVASAIEFV